jgi:hypothetical protein
MIKNKFFITESDAYNNTLKFDIPYAEHPVYVVLKILQKWIAKLSVVRLRAEGS